MKKFPLLLALICCTLPTLAYASLADYLKFKHHIYIINLSHQKQDEIEVLCKKLSTSDPSQQRIAVHRNSRGIQEAPCIQAKRDLALKHIDSATQVVVLLDEQWGQPEHPSQEDLLRREEHDWVVTQSLEAILCASASANKAFDFVGATQTPGAQEAIKEQFGLERLPEAVTLQAAYPKIDAFATPPKK